MHDTCFGFTVGQRVFWLYELRGGYGYVQPVPATVTGFTAQTVVIAAEKRDGTTVEKRVKPEKLRRRVVKRG